MAKRRRVPAQRPIAASARPAPMRWWLLALVALCTAIYATALSYPFVFDDKATVVDNASLRDLASPRVLQPDREVPTAGRPLVNVSHAVTYAIAGLDVRAYRAGN